MSTRHKIRISEEMLHTFYEEPVLKFIDRITIASSKDPSNTLIDIKIQDDDVEINLVTYRDETDDEMAFRIAKDKIWEESIKERQKKIDALQKKLKNPDGIKNYKPENLP